MFVQDLSRVRKNNKHLKGVVPTSRTFTFLVNVPGRGRTDILSAGFEKAQRDAGWNAGFDDPQSLLRACGYQMQPPIHLWQRLSVATAVFNRSSADEEQTNGIFTSLLEQAAEYWKPAILAYKAKAQAAHKACAELLAESTVEKTQARVTVHNDDDEFLCICCMEEERSVKYRPCKHRVCCGECAAALWVKDKSCPWCREVVEEP